MHYDTAIYINYVKFYTINFSGLTLFSFRLLRFKRDLEFWFLSLLKLYFVGKGSFFYSHIR